MKALHIPTTPKIVKGIPNSFKYIAPVPKRLPRSFIYIPVKPIKIQLAIICEIILIDIGTFIPLIPSIVPTITIGTNEIIRML